MLLKKLLIFSIALLLFTTKAYSQQILKGFETEFGKTDHHGNWYSVDKGGQDYSFHVCKDPATGSKALSIDINKSSWHFLQLWLKEIDITDMPLMIFNVRTDSTGLLYIAAVENKHYKEITKTYAIEASNEYQTIFLNLYRDKEMLKGNIREIKFYMNGNEPYKGNLFFDNLKIGDAIEYPVLAINPYNSLITSAGQIVEIDVYNANKETTMEWTVEINNEDDETSWIKLLDSNDQPIDKIDGVDNQTIRLECSPNKGFMPRRAELIVTHDSIYHMSEIVTITQMPQNDFALVIDRSKSMYQFGNLESVKESIKDFVALMLENDNITVTSFNENGIVDFGIEPVSGSIGDNNSSRYKAIEAIDNLEPEGFTSVGAGIHAAQSELSKVDSIAESKIQNMVLVSDGYENFPPLFYEYFEQIAETTRIHTLGLSEPVNHNFLSYVANETNANYLYSPAYNSLKQNIRFLDSKSKHKDIISMQDIYITDDESEEFEIVVDSTVNVLFITLHHPGGEFKLRLTDPFNIEYDDITAKEKRNILYFYEDDYYKTYYISEPDPGIWKAEISNISGLSVDTVSLISGGYTDDYFETRFIKDHFKPGEPIVIEAIINLAIGDSAQFSVVADVLYPVKSYHFNIDEDTSYDTPLLIACEDGTSYYNTEGDTLYRTERIVLNDEGIGYDSSAFDGIYTGSFSKTDIRGSYTFEIKVEGGHETFYQRYDKKTIVVADETYDEELLTVTVPVDFFSIQEAIDSVYAWGGGVVNVKEGTYYENITNYNTVWVIGEGDPAKTIIDGGRRHNVVRMDSVVEGGIIGFTVRNSQRNGNFAGIKMTGSQTPVVANCIFKDNRHGMFIAGDVRAFITNNNILKNNGDGIRISGSSQSVIINNIIMNNNSRGLIANGQPVRISGYNNIWNNNTDYHKIEPGEGAISEDPDFIDYENGDYRLSESSPCTNAGHHKIPNLDATRSDIGVYGGLHKYWRNLFISKELVLEGEDSDYVFGETDVSIRNRYGADKSEPAEDNQITVSKYNEKLFLADEKQKSFNSLWNIYANEANGDFEISISYDENDISDNNIEEKRLALARYNVGEQKWDEIENSEVDLFERKISAEVSDIAGYWTVVESSALESDETKIQDITRNIEFIEAFPNPVYDRNLNIRFKLAEEKEMTIQIYNSQGKYIAPLTEQQMWEPGEHNIQWDGTNMHGNRVATDIYFILFRSASGTASVKAIIIN